MRGRDRGYNWGMELPIKVPADELTRLCQRHHIRKLALFGSVLGKDFGPASDVDVLVEFEPGARVSLFDMGEAQVDLSELLGREVDLKTPGFLSRYFRDDVIRTALTLYER